MEAKGSISGGTIASALNLFEELASQPNGWRHISDPYSMAPPSGSRRAESRDPRFAWWSEALGCYLTLSPLGLGDSKVRTFTTNHQCQQTLGGDISLDSVRVP